VEEKANERDVDDQLMELAGGDPFVDVRRQSETHQREHGCGLHNAGAPQMQLIAAIAQLRSVFSISVPVSGIQHCGSRKHSKQTPKFSESTLIPSTSLRQQIWPTRPATDNE
jgi:hypothetical protein